jgi:hypothetical protein
MRFACFSFLLLLAARRRRDNAPAVLRRNRLYISLPGLNL